MFSTYYKDYRSDFMKKTDNDSTFNYQTQDNCTNKFRGPEGPRGPRASRAPCGKQGPSGSPGSEGPPGDCCPPPFVQLFDSSYTNILSSHANLNLANGEIDPSYINGGFTLTTSTVTNDTLNLPGLGLYKIYVSLRTNFSLPSIPPPILGTDYQITFNLINRSNQILLPLTVFDAFYSKTTLNNHIVNQILYNATEANPQLKITLNNFNFLQTSDGLLRVYEIILIVQKIR